MTQFVSRGKALDLGCGEGRNAFYLAQQGFEVIGIDKSREGLTKMRRLAEEYDLASMVETVFGDFCKMDLGAGAYTLIISAYALVFCRWREQLGAISKIERSLQPGGCVYIFGLTTDDLDYQRRKRTELEIEPQTLRIEWPTTDHPPFERAMCLLFARKPEVFPHTALPAAGRAWTTLLLQALRHETQ